MPDPPARPPATGFAHEALLYRTLEEFLAGTTRFLWDGLAAGDAALVSIPGTKIEPLRAALGSAAERVRFADMTRVGRNPARIIPFVQEFTAAQGGRRVSFVGEPIWPGRTAAEIREGVRHEALLNAAFADANIDIFCPYDVAGLDADTVLDAWRTHPLVVELGEWRSSACYTDPAVLYAAADRPMPAPPPGTPVVRYGPADLPALRRWTERELGRAGLDRNRTDDLLVAVNELATNTVAHTTSGGTLRIWLDTEESCLICELRDIGCIDDMIAGRRRPAADAEHGRGLWIVNQLCDLVELRSGPAGTTIRLHARRERRPAWQPDPAYW